MPKDDPLHITFCPSVTATKRNKVANNQYKELHNYCQFLKLRKLSSACNTEASDIAHKLHSLYREFISASKRWHGLLSSLDNLRIISARLAPDLTRLVGW